MLITVKVVTVKVGVIRRLHQLFFKIITNFVRGGEESDGRIIKCRKNVVKDETVDDEEYNKQVI